MMWVYTHVVGGRRNEWNGVEEAVKGGRIRGGNCKPGAHVVGRRSEFTGGREGVTEGRIGADECVTDVTLLVV